MDGYLRCSKRKGPCTQKYMREEEFRDLVRRAVHEVAISDELAAELLREFSLMSERDALLAVDEVARLKREMEAAEDRRERLWDAYYGRVISVEEFRDRSSRLVLEQKDLEAKTAAVEKSAGGWFEPVERFVNASFEATCVADRNDPSATWKFLKNVGSNLTLRDRRLQWAPRGAWKLLVDEEVAQPDESGAESGGATETPENRAGRIKRRGGDSNPRYTCAYTAFPVLLLQPLGHLSGEGREFRTQTRCCLWGGASVVRRGASPSGTAERPKRSTNRAPRPPRRRSGSVLPGRRGRCRPG